MRSFLALVICPWLCSLVFWLLFGACVANVPDEPEPVSRLIASWDPLACGDPHRVVVELEDETGDPVVGSTPCWLGGIALDLPRWGWYTGRIYTWVLDQPIRSIRPVTIPVDAPVIRWQIATPP